MLGPLGEPDDLQYLGCAPPAITVPEPELGSEVKVVPHAELLENAGHLELDTHPEPGDPESIPAGDVTALEADGAGAGTHRAAQHSKEGRLAGPVRADQTTELTGIDGQIEMNGSQSAEVFRERRDFQNALGHAFRLPQKRHTSACRQATR